MKSAADSSLDEVVRRDQLQCGQAESRTLGEILALDHAQLLGHVIPSASAALRREAALAQSLGILARMQSISMALREHTDVDTCRALSTHQSDTVRGWAWFALAAAGEGSTPVELIELVRPAADDPHFGVREWAWLAVRPSLALELDESIRALAKLTGDPSERIRRFASETLRPRGVWAKHIAVLKTEPDRGLPILEPLKADGSRYVQDSVANWINDAAKSQPDWARALEARWMRESSTDATARILRRGLRSL